MEKYLIGLMFIFSGCLNNQSGSGSTNPIGKWTTDFTRSIQDSNNVIIFNVKIDVNLMASDSCQIDQYVNNLYSNGFDGNWKAYPDSVLTYVKNCYKGNSGVKTPNSCNEDFKLDHFTFLWNGDNLALYVDSTKIYFRKQM
jgi:hypothetical protein